MIPASALNKKIFWLCLNALIIISLCIAFIALFNKSQSLNFKIQFNLFYLAGLILLQMLILSLSMQGWETALYSFAQKAPQTLDSFIHTAFILAGKYIPGKIWGILARGVVASQLGFTKQQLIHASIYEQSIMALSGVTLAVIFLIAKLNLIAACGCTLAGILITYFFSQYLLNTLQWLINKLGTFTKRWADPTQNLETITAKTFTQLYLIYSLQWLCIAGTVLCLALLLNENLNFSQACLISAAFIASVMVGFLFLLSPGGIGIRESTFILLSSGLIGLEFAFNIALLHRAWVTLYDCLVGLCGYTLFLLKNKNTKTP